MKLQKIKPRLVTVKTVRLPMAHELRVNTVERQIEGAWRPVEVVHRLRGRALQATRLRLWTEDPHCASCGRLVAYPAGFELDHIVGVANHESSNDDGNLQVLCVDIVDGKDAGCHAVKTLEEARGRGRSKPWAPNSGKPS